MDLILSQTNPHYLLQIQFNSRFILILRQHLPSVLCLESPRLNLCTNFSSLLCMAHLILNFTSPLTLNELLTYQVMMTITVITPTTLRWRYTMGLQPPASEPQLHATRGCISKLCMYYKNYTIIYAAMHTTVRPANRLAMSRVVLGHKKVAYPCAVA
jgi:hypothetical protein